MTLDSYTPWKRWKAEGVVIAAPNVFRPELVAKARDLVENNPQSEWRSIEWHRLKDQGIRYPVVDCPKVGDRVLFNYRCFIDCEVEKGVYQVLQEQVFGWWKGDEFVPANGYVMFQPDYDPMLKGKDKRNHSSGTVVYPHIKSFGDVEYPSKNACPPELEAGDKIWYNYKMGVRVEQMEHRVLEKSLMAVHCTDIFMYQKS